jgi:hypothetical protein
MSDGQKPGYKTTEWWGTLVVHLLTALTASGVFPDTHWIMKAAAFLASAVAQLGYNNSRGLAKSGK